MELKFEEPIERAAIVRNLLIEPYGIEILKRPVVTENNMFFF